MIVFFESFKFWLDRVWGERRVVLEEIRSLGQEGDLFWGQILSSGEGGDK